MPKRLSFWRCSFRVSYDFSPFYMKHFRIGLSCLSPLSACYFYRSACIACATSSAYSLPSSLFLSLSSNKAFPIDIYEINNQVIFNFSTPRNIFTIIRKLVSRWEKGNIYTVDLTKKKIVANLFLSSTERKTNKSDWEKKTGSRRTISEWDSGQNRHGRSRKRGRNGRNGLLTLFRGWPSGSRVDKSR